jgi:CHASE3 domain sensor protein
MEKKEPLVPPLAELKMLKMLQVDVHQRTKVVDAGRAKRTNLTETEKVEIKTVSDRQKKVADMATELNEMIKKQQEQQEKGGGM